MALLRVQSIYTHCYEAECEQNDDELETATGAVDTLRTDCISPSLQQCPQSCKTVSDFYSARRVLRVACCVLQRGWYNSAVASCHSAASCPMRPKGKQQSSHSTAGAVPLAQLTHHRMANQREARTDAGAVHIRQLALRTVGSREDGRGRAGVVLARTEPDEGGLPTPTPTATVSAAVRCRFEGVLRGVL